MDTLSSDTIGLISSFLPDRELISLALCSHKFVNATQTEFHIRFAQKRIAHLLERYPKRTRTIQRHYESLYGTPFAFREIELESFLNHPLSLRVLRKLCSGFYTVRELYRSRRRSLGLSSRMENLQFTPTFNEIGKRYHCEDISM
jgi:hypothetical protein